MPKDKIELKILSAKDEAIMRGLATVADYSDKEAEEEKAEPCEAQDCYYFVSDSKCPGPMGDECHYVIKNGRMVMAHKRCHQRDQNGEKKTPNVIIR